MHLCINALSISRKTSSRSTCHDQSEYWTEALLDVRVNLVNIGPCTSVVLTFTHPAQRSSSMQPTSSINMPKRNLLLCFDAFGTLFTPKRPIAQQYGEVARSLGHRGFTDNQVNDSFKAAFKQEAKQNPNFGKANGMNAEQWWTKVCG